MRSRLLTLKSQAESGQQHLALYINRHLRSVAIMIVVTSRHVVCTLWTPDYSQMPDVTLQAKQIFDMT